MKRNIVLFVSVLTVLSPLAYSISLSRTRAYGLVASAQEVGDGRGFLGSAISARAAGRGNPWITLRDGHTAPADYQGSSRLVPQLKDNQARPLSLASADFDEDGVPDLVAGYAGMKDGVISIQRGDVDAIFPNTSEAIAHREQLRAPKADDIQSPFFATSRVFDMPGAPQLIGTGDFDADGHRDVVAAEIGASALVLLPGDGDGGFTLARSIALPGVVTALVTGDANRMDGLADVIVAVTGAAGARLLVFEASAGALNAAPEVISLPSESRSLAIGQLDDDYPVDMAVAAGRDLLIVHGRDRKHSSVEGKTLDAQPARVTRLSGLFSITSLAIGDFTGDLRNEIALLSDDAKCHVFSRVKSTKGASWKETSAAALPLSQKSPPVGSSPVLVPVRISSSPKDDLLLLDQAGRQLHMIINESASAPDSAAKGSASASLRVAGALDIDGEPVAVLGMRLNVDALSDLVVLKSDASAPTVIPTTPAATFTVINTDDSGAGSLRQAIISANSNAGTDLINFAIPGSGTQTINPLSALPTITGPVTIDGTTQNPVSATPPIEVAGTSAGPGVTGLRVGGGNSTVRGLVINRFADENGIGIQLFGNNVIIEGNFIGTNATGTAGLANDDTGLLINAGSGHLIGGTTAAARNVISGNGGQGVQVLLGPAMNHQLQGNFIGTDATGAFDLGNVGDGIFMLSGATNIMNCTVGGTAAGARNVISANGGVGVEFLTVGISNLVQGNFIGTDVTGSNDLGNDFSGVALSEAANNTVGGTVAGAGNVISGNGADGVRINSPTATLNLVQGNKIGTRGDGVTPLANSGQGILFLNSASTNTIGGVAGEGNIIAFNLGAGVKVETGTGNAIMSNSIFSNSGLGIDLGLAGVTANDVNDVDGGANTLQNFPVLSSANGGIGGGVNVQGTLNSTANTTFTLHFYASTSCDGSGNGEGQTFLGSAMATTVGNNVTFDITLPGASASVGQVITATATNPQGSTSEFSACVAFGAADLAISKTASSPTIVAGSNVTYTITLTNNGPDPASSITVTDNLPLSLSFVSCSSTANGVCGGSGNNRTVSFTTLASGASATITLVASLSCSVAGGAIVGNTALVTSPVRDPVSGNNSSTVNFTASNPPREISPTSESYASNGGDGIVSVTAPSGCPWQATSNDPWITITSGSSGSGLGTVGYHVAVNATGSPRIGTITIAGLTFTVNQSNASCQFTLVPTSDSFPAEGGGGTISITTLAGCTWKVISNDSWIIGPSAGGTGSGSANYTVEPNPDSSPRTGTMTIEGQTFTVDQAGNPSAVSLVSFTANEYDTGVVVQWRTGMEVENLGFRVYRQQAGQRVRITPEIVAGSALIAGNRTTMTAGNSYAWWDNGIADCGSRIGDCRDVQYWLEDIDLNGKATLYGPIASQKVGGAPSQHSTASVLSRMGKGAPKITQLLSSRPSPLSASQKQTAAPWDLPSQPGIKLTIREEGWYRVTQPELVAAGLDPKTDPRNVRLYLEGQELALLVVGEQDGAFDQGDAIEFYAAGQDLPSTDTHTYWLAGGKQPGKRINSVRSDPKPGGAGSFAYTVERKEKTIYFSSLRNGDAENFFGPVIASQPVDQELTLQHLDSAAPGEALLEIALQGVTDLPGIGHDHQVKVMLNGAQAGRMMFDGRQHSIEKITVPQGLLREGANVVTLIAEGGLSDVTLVDYVRVTYWHAYAADQDTLRMNIQAGEVANQSQTINDFSNGSIRVLDITNGGEPQELIGRIEKQKDGRFAVTVDVHGDGSRTLIAFTEDRVKATVSTSANQVSFWRESSHAADLLIITHRDFSASLAPLKALRQRQGFDVEVVDIEDIYDEFSFGEKRPEAVKEFLSLISATWKKAPRFVLFVGDASFDGRNYLGAGDLDFVPTKLIDTFYLETGSDDWFADFNDDGLAEMFVGRLPVRTASETAALVSKIVGYDSADSKSVIAGRSVLLVADRNDGFNFEQASEQLRALVPAGVGVQEIFRGRLDDAAAKKQLIEAINAGKSIVNYIGHGSTNVWRDLFTNEDAQALNNQQRLPLFVTMTCLNGFFHDPVIESLGEALLKSERGGAIAVWASSGLTGPAQQTAMNQQAYRLLFDAPGKLTLGEVTARAKSAVRDKDVRRTWILLGDPTSRLR